MQTGHSRLEMKLNVFLETIPTGQAATYTLHSGYYYNGTVKCHKCNKVIGLQDHSLDGATGLAWYDDVIGAYTHRKCLTVK